MSELKRDDIISEDALQAPLVLVENLEKVVMTLTKIRNLSKQSNDTAQASESIREITSAVSELNEQQKEVIKVNNQLATSLAKDTDEYAKLKKKVDEANQSAKTRVQLGDREAINITKQNASLNQLQAALAKNRQEYAKLTNEQERNSAHGKKLLTVIQQQDKDFKGLSGTLGQHQAHVGDYAGQLGKANTAVQAFSPTLHGMANALWAGVKAAAAFVATPLGLTLAALGLVISPVIAYFTSTAEGQDRVNAATAEYNARLQVLIDRLTNTGREMSKSREEMTEFDKEVEKGPRNFVKNWGALLGSFFPKLTKDMKDAGDAARELAETVDAVGEAEAKYGVEVAELEVAQKRLILQSKNRTLSEEERISKIDEALEMERTITTQRIKFADQLLEAEVNSAQARLKIEGEIDQSLIGDNRVQAYREFAKRLIDAGREKDDGLSDSLIEALKKQTEAEALSVVVEEKLQNQRDALSDKRLERIEKERAAREKAKQQEMDEIRELYDFRVRVGELEYLKEKELRDKEAKEHRDLIDGINKRNEDRKAREKKQSEDRVKQLQKEKEANIKHLEEMLFYYQDYSNAILNLTGSITEGKLQNIDAQISKLEEQTAKEIDLAGDNERAKIQIEESAGIRRKQLESQRKTELRRQATIQKTAALIEAAIITSLNVIKALGDGPPWPNVGKGVLAGALGAIQIAAIASKPIPQFFRGTDNAPEGIAFVGERGRELKVEPSGKMSLTPGVPTLDYLKAGTQIIPHNETMKMLALSGLGTDVLMQREQTQQIELVSSLKKIEENTRKIGRSSGGNLYAQGILTYEQKIKEDGSKQHIRKSALGK